MRLIINNLLLFLLLLQTIIIKHKLFAQVEILLRSCKILQESGKIRIKIKILIRFKFQVSSLLSLPKKITYHEHHLQIAS